MSELRPLLADAERRVDRLGAGGRDPLGTRLHDLQRSLDGAPPRAADRCRALAAARAAAARLPPSPATAADRSAIALVLDLAAATLHDLDESHR